MSTYDYVVIGAGPAGLQLGHELQRRGCDYLILEAADAPGSFFRRFPRHRQLISINKVNTGCRDRQTNLRWDWNSLLCDDPRLDFTRRTARYFPHADDYLTYLADFATTYALRIRYGAVVEQVARDRDSFLVCLNSGVSLTARRVIVAAGLSRPHVPDIPGIEHAQSYFTFPTDPQIYRNQRILIIGKGNSAFETAESLIEYAASIHLCSPHPVSMAWKTHYVGNLRAVNNNFLDTYQLKSQNVILDARIDQIRADAHGYEVDITYTHAMEEKRSILFDKILMCTGFRFDDSIFDENCRPALMDNGRLPALSSSWESVNIPGLYFAGSLMQARDYKKTSSGFVHGFRHNIQTLANILARRYHREEWPVDPQPAQPLVLAKQMIARLNTSAPLFLLNGFMCDLIVAPSRGGVWHYYNDMPVDYIHDHPLNQDASYYTMVLDYGDATSITDPFNVVRDPSPAAAAHAYYLHPIIRHYTPQGGLLNELHLIEDLENVYSSEKYVNAITEFLKDATKR
jgi:thioredoxin reductase